LKKKKDEFFFLKKTCKQGRQPLHSSKWIRPCIYGLGKDRAAEFLFLDEPLRLGESASVAGGAVIDADGVNHAVAVEEVVPSDGLKQRVGSRCGGKRR
jgi:hypothetical protein